MPATIDTHNSVQLDRIMQEVLCLGLRAVKEKPYGRLTLTVDWREHCFSLKALEAKETEVLPAFKPGK